MSGLEQQILDAERRLFARTDVRPVASFVTVGDPPLRLRILEMGSGPAVLLVHPVGLFAASWAPLVPHLSGYRLICLDFPGHGLSEGVDYRRHPPRSHTVAMLSGLLGKLGASPASLIGNSLGGMAALWLAADAPRHVSSIAILGVPGMVLPGVRPDTSLAVLSVPLLNRFLLRIPSSPERSTELIAGRMGKGAVDRVPPEVFEIHYLASRRPVFAPTLATFMQCTLRWKQPRRGIALSDADLRGITHRVLFIWGDGDALGPPALGRHVCEQMPRGTLQVFPGGHFPQLEDAPTCGALIRSFL